MLSRFAFRGKDLTKCLVVRAQSSAPTTTPAKQEPCPPSGTNQRDYVNFPDIVMREYPPPHKFGLIPASWFDFFYPKTGYTGPYMFLFGLTTWALSKEVFIWEHNAAHLAALVMLCSAVTYKFGDKIGEAYNKYFQAYCDKLDSSQKQQIENLKTIVDNAKAQLYGEDFITEVSKLKKEIVHFQMEAAYRERLAEVHEKIKRSLEYQMAIENIDRSFLHKNLVDYVIRNVLSSITPDKEKLVLEKCISDLNTLAAKA